MRGLFTHAITVMKRILTSDDYGGNAVEYEESDSKWRVRVSGLDGEFVEDMAGREYPSGIRIVGESRDDIAEGDRVIYHGHVWEIISSIRIDTIGSIPSYLRAIARRIGEES